MGDERSSGSNAGLVILIALLVLALPCCGGVALLGLGVFSFRSVAAPAPPEIMVAPPMTPADRETLIPIIPEVPEQPREPATTTSDPVLK